MQVTHYKSAELQGPQKVFVYGTLKKGYYNHENLMTNAKFLGISSMEGIMFHLGGFPAINLAEHFSTIAGEVYEVDVPLLKRLDVLEGVERNFYDRIKTSVRDYGGVWTYIFPYNRASTEKYVIPSGCWQGPETPKLPWLGFGKGVAVGKFEAAPAQGEIKIGAGESDFVLRKDTTTGSYVLVNKKTGEISGTYRHLRDMTSKDGRVKPVIRLPPRVNPPESAVQQTLDAATPVYPVIWTPPGTSPEEKLAMSDPTDVPQEKIPQAARLLGLKYGEA